MKFLLVVISLLITLTAAADLSEYAKLVSEKKYETAYRALEKEDSKNENPDVFAKKLDLAQNYFAICMNGEVFGFRDLAQNEEITSVRGKTGAYKMYTLRVADVGARLLAKFPNNAQLRIMMGHFYYFGICKVDENLVPLAEANYLAAKKLGTFDYRSLRSLGVFLLERHKPVEALKEFNEALKLNNKDADTFYNIAHANLALKKNKEAASNAAKAYELYTDKKLKSEAALLATYGYWDSKDEQSALKYADLANKNKDGNYYYIFTKLLEIYTEMKKWEQAADISDQLLALQPTNPQMPQDVLKAYVRVAAPKELDKFFERNLTKYSANKEALGNLHFHRALFYAQNQKKNEAKKDFEAARDNFSAVLKPNHEVFKAIAVQLSNLK